MLRAMSGVIWRELAVQFLCCQYAFIQAISDLCQSVDSILLMR